MAHDQRPATFELREKRTKGEELKYEVSLPLKPESLLVPTTHNPVPAKSQALAGATPWPVRQPLYPDGREAFFPIAPQHAVYEIEISGVFEFSVQEGGPFAGKRYQVEADALSFSGGGRHNWLWINGNTLDYCLRWNGAEILRADYAAHAYCIVISDPDKQLTLALQMPAHVPPSGSQGRLACFNRRGSLIATARPLPPGTPTLKEQKKVKPPDDPQRAPRLTPDEVRERDLRWDEVRAKDFHARVMAIARREQEALAEIDHMVGISEDNRENYRNEVKDFASAEIAKLRENRKEGMSNNVKTI